MNKKTKKHKFWSLPSTKISIIHYLISSSILIIVALMLPSLLNYPPHSINTAFDIQMSGISYVSQFLCIDIGSLFLLNFLMRLIFKPIDEWFLNRKDSKYSIEKNINFIRNRCINLPFIVFLTELIVPIIVCIAILNLTGSHEKAMIIKLTALMMAAAFLLAVLSYIFTKNLFSKLLSATYKKDSTIGLRITLNKKILMQITPVCIIGLLVMALIGYSKSIETTENAWFEVYNYSLLEAFPKNKLYTYDEIKNTLQNIKTYSHNVSLFILDENGKYELLSGPPPSYFIIKYTIEFAEANNGRTYDSYAVDTQGTTIKLHTEDGDYFACIIYHTESNETLSYILIAFFLLLGLMFIIILIFTHSLTKDISTISDRLKHIFDTDSIDSFTTLPVVSNDEISDLCEAYNNIQEMNKKNLQTIKNSQELLIERERLASLGQMIGRYCS